MNDLIKTYQVKVVREAGPNPVTGELWARAEDDLGIDATSPQAAHRIAQMITTLKFCGQVMVIYVDGDIHPDENF